MAGTASRKLISALSVVDPDSLSVTGVLPIIPPDDDTVKLMFSPFPVMIRPNNSLVFRFTRSFYR